MLDQPDRTLSFFKVRFKLPLSYRIVSGHLWSDCVENGIGSSWHDMKSLMNSGCTSVQCVIVVCVSDLLHAAGDVERISDHLHSTDSSFCSSTPERSRLSYRQGSRRDSLSVEGRFVLASVTVMMLANHLHTLRNQWTPATWQPSPELINVSIKLFT